MSHWYETGRKAWPLLATFCLLLAFAACGGGEENGDGATATSGGGSATPAGATPGATISTPVAGGKTVEISMWHDNVAATLDAIEGLVNRFNSSQSEVKVKLAFQGTDAEEMAKLVISLGGGDLPNIVQESEPFTQRLMDSGAVVPIQEFIDRDDYDLSDLNEKAIGYYTVNGTLQAMPFGVVLPMLYYNKNVFRDAGLDPESPPNDLEEVRQISEKLLQRDAHGNVTRTGLAIDISAWLLEFTIAEHGDLYADNENGRAGRPTEVLFDGPTGQALFQWWHDMIEDDLAINVGRNPTYAETYLTLGTGRAAMAFGFSSALSSVVDALEGGLAQTKVDLAISHLPGVPGGTGLSGIGTRSLWIMKSNAEEQEASWKFIKWLMEPEQQAEWYAGSSYLPVNLEAFDLPAATEIETKYPQFKDAAQLYLASSSSPEVVLGALFGPYLAAVEIIMNAVEEMLVGGKDPIEALNDAAETTNEIVEEYNRRVE